MVKIARFGLPFFDRRKSKRSKIFEPAILSDGSGERRAHVLDVSPSGALAYAERPPAEGLGITLRFGGLVAMGGVAWVEGKHFGVTFIEPLDPHAVARLLET